MFQVFDNSTSIYFHNGYSDEGDVNTGESFCAFQGFVLFDDWGDESCPLESISRVDPFEFENETQIIYLQSSFYANSTRKHPCQWQFSAPEGYGFKFVVEVLNVVYPVQLKIQNSTEVIKRWVPFVKTYFKA